VEVADFSATWTWLSFKRVKYNEGGLVEVIGVNRGRVYLKL